VTALFDVIIKANPVIIHWCIILWLMPCYGLWSCSFKFPSCHAW